MKNRWIVVALIVALLGMGKVTPSYASVSGPWDGLRVETDQYQAFEQPDHPPFTGQNAVGSTLLVVSVPAYLAAIASQAGAAAFQETTSMGWIQVAILVGALREWQTNPRKFGAYQYNGQVVTGESAKWERDPEALGWNRLVRHSTIGPGLPERSDTGMPFDRIIGTSS